MMGLGLMTSQNEMIDFRNDYSQKPVNRLPFQALRFIHIVECMLHHLVEPFISQVVSVLNRFLK